MTMRMMMMMPMTIADEVPNNETLITMESIEWGQYVTNGRTSTASADKLIIAKGSPLLVMCVFVSIMANTRC